MKLKRYLLFTGDTSWPSGGWGDFQESFDSIMDVLSFLNSDPQTEFPPDWAHVVDIETGQSEELFNKERQQQ